MNEEKLGHSETGHCIVRPHKGPLKFRKEAHAFLNPPHALGQANYCHWHFYVTSWQHLIMSAFGSPRSGALLVTMCIAVLQIGLSNVLRIKRNSPNKLLEQKHATDI